MRLHQGCKHLHIAGCFKQASPRFSKLIPRASAVATPAVASLSASSQIEDKWLAKNVPSLQNHTVDSRLGSVRSAALEALSTLRMPTTRNEEYRFTDMSALLKTTLVAVESSNIESVKAALSDLVPAESANSYVVVLDGVPQFQVSNLSALPQGTYVGGVAGAPEEVVQKLNTQASGRGGPFSVLNSASMRDVVVVAVPGGATVEAPLFVLHLSSESSSEGVTTASAPRLLVHVAQDALCSLVEEWMPVNAGATSSNGTGSAPARQTIIPTSFSCAVAEIFLEKGAQISHSYVVREAAGAVHVKATLVDQAESSTYSLTEARVGGGLTRHDVSIQQSGPTTSTTMKHFLLAGANQLHDLHTKLALEHPEGQANQLHKCIVTSASGRGVFDGNVHVGRYAQRTDAGQLSRNLLLAPRATVNVKPNLQIIADDVKCTHGCAVSDLSEEELFYFRARGINELSARQSLVSSFGAEVTQSIKMPALRSRIQQDVQATLRQVDLAAIA